MKIIKKLLTLCLFAVMMFLAIHTPISEDAIHPNESEVVIKHNVDNQKIIHNQKPIYAIVHRTPVFMIAANGNKSEEAAYHVFLARSKQKEGALFKQRARSSIGVRSISLKRGYNGIKKNKCSYCAILGGTDIWITKRKLLR